MQIILQKKMEHYAAIERQIIDMRTQIAGAHQDMDHLLRYSEALQQYFKTRSDTAAVLNQSSQQLIQTLDSFVKTKK
jgi:hypothetical protein